MFGKKQGDNADIATLIGAGTIVTGDMDFRGGLHLEGRIVGDVRGAAGSSATLTVGHAAVIEGSVSVDALVLNGAVHGDVLTRERVELGPTARVEGNVTYKVLQMAAGARVDGRLIHQPEDGPGAPSGPEGDEAPGVR